MNPITLKGIIRNGRVEVAEPINLPDGSEVTITSSVNGAVRSEPDRPMTPSEIAETLAAMARVEPFDMTPEEGENVDTPQSTGTEATGLPAWCNFYAGLSEEDIEDIERIAHDRSNFMRPVEEDAE
jgi:hypothetical protein